MELLLVSFVCLFVSFIFAEFLFDGPMQRGLPICLWITVWLPFSLVKPSLHRDGQSSTHTHTQRAEPASQRAFRCFLVEFVYFLVCACSFVVVVVLVVVVVVGDIVELCPNGGFASPSCAMLCCIILGNKADSIFILLAIYPFFDKRQLF